VAARIPNLRLACDSLVALGGATADGAALFAKNSDRPPSEVQVVEWSSSRRDTAPVRTTHIEVEPHPRPTLGCVLSRPSWCWGAEHGVNEAGVAMGNATVYTTADPRQAAPALIGMDLVRLALERADSAAGAVDVVGTLLDRHGQGGSGHDPAHGERPYWSSFLIADPSAAWIVDTSGDEWMAAPVATVAAISNRTSIPEFDAAHRHPRQPVERLVDPRLTASRRVLDARPVTRAALVEHLRSHDSCGEPGWSVCMHVDGVEATTASMVAELRGDGGAHRAWVLSGSPCETDYVEVTVGEPFTMPARQPLRGRR
jgi:hypothetical protein